MQITIEGDLRREMSINIKRLMDLGCYRGLRHHRKMACRCAASAPHQRAAHARVRARSGAMVVTILTTSALKSEGHEHG